MSEKLLASNSENHKDQTEREVANTAAEFNPDEISAMRREMVGLGNSPLDVGNMSNEEVVSDYLSRQQSEVDFASDDSSIEQQVAVDKDAIKVKRQQMVQGGLKALDVGNMSDSEIAEYEVDEQLSVVESVDSIDAEPLDNVSTEDERTVDEESYDQARDDADEPMATAAERKLTKREKWMDIARNPGSFAAGYIAARMNGSKDVYSNTERDKDRKGLKRALGVAAIFAAGFGVAWLTKDGHDTSSLQERLVDAQDKVSDLQATIVEKNDKIESLNDQIARGDTPTGLSEVNDYKGDWSFADGSGGEALLTNNGIDASVWYQYQDEFAEKFPELTYRMSDGSVGLVDQNASTDISKLPIAAQNFWRQYQ